MKKMHWSVAYIGLPWSKDGTGPDSYHCWAFVRMVQKDRFGRDLAVIPNPDSMVRQAKAFQDHPEYRQWRQVDRPEEGDCVLMGRCGLPVHVGIWADALGGSVLHCVEGAGAVLQDLMDLEANFWNVTAYYRYRGAPGGSYHRF